MAFPFCFTPRAIDDLDEIWTYIARDNVQAANRVEEAVFDACGRLARFPDLGSKRQEITPLPVRFWTVTHFSNFVIVYRPETQPLEVIAVLHGQRDLKRALTER